MNLPQLQSTLRGKITENAPLGEVGWFGCGGTADILFRPVDAEDLAQFLAKLPPDIPVQTFGVLSNSIIRDGGVRSAVIRLGKEFAKIENWQGKTYAGAAALDGNVAMFAAREGIAGLEFFSGIPGTIGGALRMNAGCYGTETKDVLIEATAMDRQGKIHVFHCHPEGAKATEGSHKSTRSFADAQDDRMEMGYRHNSLSEDYIFLGAVFEGLESDPEKIKSYIREIKERRNATQPIREKTGGSTFANPSREELVAAGLPEDTKTWQLIEKAGGRGLTIGGAQMSEKHCNFMINTGSATAADLENLGEEIRKRVRAETGISLRWEIKRIGDKEKI